MTEALSEYREDSPVAKNKEKLLAMVNGHWKYVEQLIITTMGKNPEQRMYSYEDMMAMREFDYISAFVHAYGHGVEDTQDGEVSMTDCVERQKSFALNNFGSGHHTEGLTRHILTELEEIDADPSDTEEWVDVIILAMEGAWRTGASPKEVADIFNMKMTKNENRVWPKPEDQIAGKPIEHIKED